MNPISVVTSDGGARTAPSASPSPAASAESAINLSAANARRGGSDDSAIARYANWVRYQVNSILLK